MQGQAADLKLDIFQAHEPKRLRILVEHYLTATNHLIELLGKHREEHVGGSEADQYLEELCKPLA